MLPEVIFPPKVSGFYERKSGPPALLPVADLKQALHDLDGLGIQWQLIDFSHQPNYSYHVCFISWQDKGYFFFMNKYYYLAAFSQIEDMEEWQNWEEGQLLPRNQYTDIPQLHDILSTPWTILPEEMIIQKVDADNEISQKIVMNLQNAEFAEFSYWEPQNMGNILFNNWEK